MRLPPPCASVSGSFDQFDDHAGWLIIATCEVLMLTVLACARAAMTRSASGGMMRSCLATRYHLGMVFHAGAPEGSRVRRGLQAAG